MKTITLNFSTYDLNSVTGKVLSTGKNMESHVYSTGGYNTPVSVKTRTTIHDQVFLEDSAGVEHSFQLSDFNIASREGNTLTVIRAKKPQRKKGLYISVINHSTGKIFFDPIAMDMLCRPNKYILGALTIVLAIIGFKISYGKMTLPFIILFFGIIYYPLALRYNKKRVTEAINPADYLS